MEDARRFVRFVLPGLVGLLVGLGILWVCGALPMPQNDAAIKILGLVIGSLPAAGTLGYASSLLYHQFHWSPFGYPVSHGKILSQYCPEKAGIDRHADWVVFSSIWILLQDKVSSKSIKSATERSKEYADKTHSSGTAFISVGIAYFASLFVLFLNNHSQLYEIKAPIVFLAGGLFLRVLWGNHKRLCRFNEKILNIVFNELAQPLKNELSEVIGRAYDQYSDSQRSSTTRKAPSRFIDHALNIVCLLCALGLVALDFRNVVIFFIWGVLIFILIMLTMIASPYDTP